MLGEPKVGFLLSLYWARHELGQPHDKDKKPIMGGCRLNLALRTLEPRLIAQARFMILSSPGV